MREKSEVGKKICQFFKFYSLFPNLSIVGGGCRGIETANSVGQLLYTNSAVIPVFLLC